MGSFQYSNEPSGITTNISGNLALKPETSGITTTLTTDMAKMTTGDLNQENTVAYRSNPGNAAVTSPEVANMFHHIEAELQKIENYAPANQMITDQTKLEISNIMNQISKELNRLEAFYPGGNPSAALV